jgi:hypothetical protein
MGGDGAKVQIDLLSRDSPGTAVSLDLDHPGLDETTPAENQFEAACMERT